MLSQSQIQFHEMFMLSQSQILFHELFILSQSQIQFHCILLLILLLKLLPPAQSNPDNGMCCVMFAIICHICASQSNTPNFSKWALPHALFILQISSNLSAAQNETQNEQMAYQFPRPCSCMLSSKRISSAAIQLASNSGKLYLWNKRDKKCKLLLLK